MRRLPDSHSLKCAIVIALAMMLAFGIVSAGFATQAKSAAPQPAEPDLLAKLEAEAANGQATDALSKEKQEPVYITLLSFIFKLAVVVALAYGTIYALKKLNVGALKRNESGLIKIVENTTLGTNRSLHVVRVGDKTLLLASTPGQINLLSEVDLPIEELTATEESTGDSGAATSFTDRLNMCLGGAVDSGDAASNIAGLLRGSSAFLQDKIAALGNLRKKLKDA